MTAPYYADDLVTLYHGDFRDTHAWLDADVLVSDVPYGIDYRSNQRRQTLARSIEGDKDTVARDWALTMWQQRREGEWTPDAPALIFGTWRIPRPEATRQVLIWDTKGALGMGAMDLPWKPAHQEIYVLGKGFAGRRTTDVLVYPPVQSLGYNGRLHPHEKPIGLMQALIDKCPPGAIADPFAGSGSTLAAAKQLGRRAIGVEIDERYCEIAAKRLAQDTLFGAEPTPSRLSAAVGHVAAQEITQAIAERFDREFRANEVRCVGCDQWVPLDADPSALPKQHVTRCLGGAA